MTLTPQKPFLSSSVPSTSTPTKAGFVPFENTPPYFDRDFTHFLDAILVTHGHDQLLFPEAYLISHGVQSPVTYSTARAPESSSIQNNNNEELHKQLYKTIKQIVSNSAAPLKQVVPLEQSQQALQISEDKSTTIFEDPSNKRSRGQTTINGQLNSLSFTLPEGFSVGNLDLEKLVPLGSEETYEISRIFSFSERLEGWNIESRLRSNLKQSDLYYEHQRTGAKFRSLLEVVRFILYEAYPKRKTVLPNEELPAENKRKKSRSKINRFMQLQPSSWYQKTMVSEDTSSSVNDFTCSTI